MLNGLWTASLLVTPNTVASSAAPFLSPIAVTAKVRQSTATTRVTRTMPIGQVTEASTGPTAAGAGRFFEVTFSSSDSDFRLHFRLR